MKRTKRKRRRHYLVQAYVYYPDARLFDLGESLGTIDQEPLSFMLDGRPIAPSGDGSVFMTPKQARKMIERSDFANYRSYALAEAPDDDLAGEPDGSAQPHAGVRTVAASWSA
ncbi:hypothetical protein [Ramlibacter sp. AN1133]|uniref:hypothetical protein n=1 Tax=Ramlibacter sp. AN1133 TaxID=3133429 RepID=UPI0030C1F3AF